MSGHMAQRTLVKSPPELWAELSDDVALAKHLGEFGEVRITRLEPETVVAWEGERANGTVSLAPAGWGTKVTLTASPIDESHDAPVAVTEPVSIEATAALAAPEPTHETSDPGDRDAAELETSSTPASEQPKLTLLGRLKRWLTPSSNGAMWQLSDEPAPGPDDAPPAAPAPATPIRLEPPAPEPEPPAATEAQPAALADEAIVGVLTDVLDTLGAAHHRPFSRG